MALINIESLTKALDGENPCGENLRWDKAYLELERLAEGKEETQFSKGEEPDWREVRDKAVELLARGRHLRLAILLTLAAVRLEGYPGLRDGLKVIQTWLEQHWDTVWPVLDAEDNNDPTERVNALAALATPMATFGDKTRLLDRIYECPICESRQLGNFSLRDMAIASGTLAETPAAEGQASAEGGEQKPRPTLAMIDGAFAETDRERLEEIAKSAEEANESLSAISNIFGDKCGAGIGPDISHLQTILKDASTQIRRRLDGGESGSGDDSQTDTGDSSGGGGGGGRRQSLSGEVTNAQEASLALDKVIRYYEMNEPSSPVPMIVKCAQVMVGKGFRDIVRVLTPDAVSTLDNIAQAGSDGSSS
ncbi:MAG: type VI secretion protein [Phycisphaerae bacterium]|nr:MAG: type VI secretion protein [Phycisphaerae bacterium]